MRLQRLLGRPVVHVTWGWIAAWIRDVWIDAHTGRVAAFEVCVADRMQFRCVEPFIVRRSRRNGLAIESDPEQWQSVERQPSWIPVSDLAAVLVVQDDGQWSGRLVDAECDPDSWAITRYRIRRRWWQLFGVRGLASNRVVAGGPELLVVAGHRPAPWPAPASQPNQKSGSQMSGTEAGATTSSTVEVPQSQARRASKQMAAETRRRQASTPARTDRKRKKHRKGTTRRKHDRSHRH